MLHFSIDAPPRRPLSVLCLGAHCDDIEIGCGGTLLKLAQSHPDLEVVWAVFSGDDLRFGETQQSARSLFESSTGVRVLREQFPDGQLPYNAAQVKAAMEAIKKNASPDLIFSHWRGDAHQDHRFLSELTWNTFRDHVILEYEIPKYDGDIGNPNIYSSLDTDVAERKIAHLMNCYSSQAGRDWFDATMFRSLLRIRGMECRAASGFAEAFYAPKISITL